MSIFLTLICINRSQTASPSHTGMKYPVRGALVPPQCVDEIGPRICRSPSTKNKNEKYRVAYARCYCSSKCVASRKSDATFPQQVSFRACQMQPFLKTPKGARDDTRATPQICPPPEPNARRDEITHSEEALTPTSVCMLTRPLPYHA